MSREWLTKTEYVKNTDTWIRQKKLKVQETEINVRERIHASCDDVEHKTEEDKMPCYRKEILFVITCIAKERGNVYRVRISGHE